MPNDGPGLVGDEGIFCHIYNKSVENKNIFNDEADYSAFENFLGEYLLPPKTLEALQKTFTINGREYKGIPHLPKNYSDTIELIAYSLTPNEFHLVLRQLKKGSIEKFMRSLSTRYSMYYNKKYNREGSLFKGPYISDRIKDEQSLLNITSKLHALGKKSSYHHYLGIARADWVKSSTLLESFVRNVGHPNNYKEFIERFIINREPIIPKPEPTVQIEEKDTPASLERIEPALESIQYAQISSPKQIAGVLEYMAITGVFLILVAVGFHNVQASETKRMTSQVLSATDTTTNIPVSTPFPTDSPDPAVLITIKLNQASASANIRIAPDEKSKIIAKAVSGDIYEFLSTDGIWDKIKLPDNQTGYISNKLVQFISN